jgi:CRISPR type III-B/RAMP module-associated protein Cmr3
MTRLAVRIDPLDPLLFGDNRSARAGDDHALGDQDPTPATVYGAIGGRIAAALGARGQRDWSRQAEAVLGPFVAALDRETPDRAELLGYALHDAEGEPWFPKPLHLVVEERKNRRFDLAACYLPGGERQAGVVSHLETAAPLAASKITKDEHEDPLWVSAHTLGQALAGEDVDAMDFDARPAESFYLGETRVGLALSNGRHTAVGGRLFARPYRRFRGGLAAKGFRTAGYTAWLRLPGEAAAGSWNGTGFFGGDRRRARFTFQELSGETPPPLEKLRQAVLAASADAGRGFFAYLLTPAPARHGWPAVANHKPAGAAVGRPLFVSGWQGAAEKTWGPRPIETLYPAGSVFFYEWTDAEKDSAEARRQVLSQPWPLAAAPGYRYAGFGRMLLGVWR